MCSRNVFSFLARPVEHVMFLAELKLLAVKVFIKFNFRMKTPERQQFLSDVFAINFEGI